MISRRKLVVHRQEKESFDRLLQRFNKKVQGTRVILELKEKRYFQKKFTKRKIRERALMREYHRSRKEKMQYYT